MARKCLPNVAIADEPDWSSSMFVEDNLDPNAIVIDDLDLGCGTARRPGTPIPSLEGYWDREDVDGVLHPKVLADLVMVGKTAQSHDEAFGVVGKIHSTAGYMLGAGNILIYTPDNVTLDFSVVSRVGVRMAANYMRGSQANAWYLNTLSATNSAATPPYTFVGDTNTGMYRHEAGGLAFSGGGVNKLVLNANGSVQLVTTPTTAANASVPVLARNATTGLIEQRVLSELHTHSNISVLDLLTAPGGLLAYNGTLVFDSSQYYTTTAIDSAHATLLANINTRSLTTHNHNLADLTEHSYNSLVDTPDLSDLHAHSNKPTLDRIPDYTGGNQDDLLVRDGAGIAWIASDEMGVPREFVNGSFKESFNALVTSNGTIITLSLEQSGTGDLTMQFSDGNFILDCDPTPQTIELTAGSISAPQDNYIYVLQSTKALTKSIAGWPTTEHIKIGYIVCQTAAFIQTSGALVNQNWNDHLSGINNMGHMLHMAERGRLVGGAWYYSGLDGGGADDYTTSGASSVTVQVNSGVLYQMHLHNYVAKDTSGTDYVHIVNHDITPYYQTQNLYDVVDDAVGGTLTNRYFNIVLWGVANKTGEYSPLMVNLPGGSYSTLANAQRDVDGYDNFSMPRQFNRESSTGFLIAKLTFRKTGTSWTYYSTVNLRGITPQTASGGGAGGAITNFSDNQFTIYNVLDNTAVIDFDLSGITTATTRTITPYDGDITLVNYNGTTISVDAIQELTPEAGVTIETVEFKDGDIILNNTNKIKGRDVGGNPEVMLWMDDTSFGIIRMGSGGHAFHMDANALRINTATVTLDGTYQYKIDANQGIGAQIWGEPVNTMVFAYWSKAVWYGRGVSGVTMQIDGSGDLEVYNTLKVNRITEYNGGVGVTIQNNTNITDTTATFQRVDDTTLPFYWNFDKERATGQTAVVNDSITQFRGYFYNDAVTPEKIEAIRIKMQVKGITDGSEYAELAFHNIINGILVKSLSIGTDGVTFSSGASVNSIETTLTDDATHIATSAAIVAAIGGTSLTFENGLTKSGTVVKLGGVLTGDTIIEDANNPYRLSLRSYATTGSRSAEMYIDAGEIFMIAYDGTTYSGTTYSQITVHKNEARISNFVSGLGKIISVSASPTTGIPVTDNQDSIGFKYAGDYSTAGRTLGDRWIPDLAYVKGYFNDQTITITSLATDDIMKWDGSAWINTPIPSGGSTTFIGLTDTPADWTGGVGGYLPFVNSVPDALEFINPATALNRFSGSLVGNFLVTGSNSYYWRLQGSHAATGSAYIELSDNGKSILIAGCATDEYAGNTGYFYAHATNARMGLEISSNHMIVSLTSASMLITDAVNSTGFQYAGDYSTAGGALGDRWIPDKGYVDSLVTGSIYWDRTGIVLTPKNSGDEIEMTNSNYPFTAWKDSGTIIYRAYAYSDTAGHCPYEDFYHYGGSKASPTIASSDSVVLIQRGFVYDGGSLREIVRSTLKAVGAISSGSASGEFQWHTRETTGSLIKHMVLTAAGNVGMGADTPASAVGYSKYLHIANSAASGDAALVLEGDTGKWEIGVSAANLFEIYATSTALALKAEAGGQVFLYYSGGLRFETGLNGCEITGAASGVNNLSRLTFRQADNTYDGQIGQKDNSTRDFEVVTPAGNLYMTATAGRVYLQDAGATRLETTTVGVKATLPQTVQNYAVLTDLSGNLTRTVVSGSPSTDFLRGDGTWATPAGGGANPAGSDTHIQFNDGGSAFGGSVNLTWNDYMIKITQTTAYAAWSDYPASFPAIRSIYAVRGSGTIGVNNYNAFVLHTRASGSYNSFGLLGIQALSVSDASTRFNLLLTNAAGSSITVFSADGDSTYYWKAKTITEDITHKFQQAGNTIAIMGWDDSANGWQVETGGAFSSTPGIFIGYTNHHVSIGAQADNTHELSVYGPDVSVRFESTSGNAKLQVMGNDSGDDVSIELDYAGGSTGAEILWQGSSGDGLFFKNAGYTGIEISTAGRIYMPNMLNSSGANYVYWAAGGQLSYNTTSDIRLKKNIEEWQPDSLRFLMNQRLIRFDRKDGSFHGEIGWDGTLMEHLMPDMTWRDKKDYVNIKDAHFPYHMHRAIQQLGDKVAVLETLEDRVSRLERENVDLRAQLAERR